MTVDFYDDIDNIFEKLYNKYGFDEELIEAKNDIIKHFIYINDNNGDNIVTLLKKKNFSIDEKGRINSV
jgi:hypothetical protein